MVQLNNDHQDPHNDLFPILWIIIASVLLLIGASRCHAQRVDTILCKVNCIQEYVHVQKNNKAPKVFAVYKDAQNDISDLIPVSKSVYEYIVQCEAHGIEPHLGIRLKNGQITSIVRYKPTYIRRSRR